MTFSIFVAFVAGILTILAPCVLPLLPVIIGSSSKGNKINNLLMIVLSLGLSIFLFTLLLRTTLRFNPLFSSLDDSFWRSLSGIIILFFGVVSLFPGLWNSLSLKFGLQAKSDNLLEKARQNNSVFEPILLGLSLGPVFSSCSPTYFVIIGLLLAENDFGKGVILLLAYIIGLVLVMLAIGILGRVLVSKLKWASDPKGWFKKSFGVLLIVLGLGIMFGLDKQFETLLLDFGLYNGLQSFENQLTDNGSKL